VSPDVHLELPFPNALSPFALVPPDWAFGLLAKMKPQIVYRFGLS
jgi:hypothetical protein